MELHPSDICDIRGDQHIYGGRRETNSGDKILDQESCWVLRQLQHRALRTMWVDGLLSADRSGLAIYDKAWLKLTGFGVLCSGIATDFFDQIVHRSLHCRKPYRRRSIRQSFNKLRQRFLPAVPR